MREVIARLVDGSRFHEYQPAYGTTLICGFAHIWGFKVGILGNNGVLFNDSSLKGAHFMQLCNQSRVPMLFLQNITGYMVGRDYEHRGITKDGAKMIMAVSGIGSAEDHRDLSTARSAPAITAWRGGPSIRASCSCGRRARSPSWARSRPPMSWRTSKSASCRARGAVLLPAEIAAIREPILEEYRRQSSAYYSTSQLWDDGILDPPDTRNALAIAISAALNAPIDQPHYGVFRM